MVDAFWGILGGDVISLMKYDDHPKTAKLKPWIPAMFTGTSFSIYNYDTDFFELVKSDLVDVHISEIDHLSPGKVHLVDGTELPSDAMLAHNGWKHVPPVKFAPEGIEKEMGLPHIPDESGTAPFDDLANQKQLLDRVDQDILARFPRLKDQPVWNKQYVPLTDQKGIECQKDEVTPYTPMTPYMLYHFLVPPSKRFLRSRDIAFVGIVGNFSNVITAHLQGLWVSAYFSGKLAVDPAACVEDDKSMDQLRYETMLQNRFGKWRYPVDWGSKAPSFIFDAVPYLDQLQLDLGLARHHKASWWSEIWDPYGPEDYRRINEAWLEKYGPKAKDE